MKLEDKQTSKFFDLLIQRCISEEKLNGFSINKGLLCIRESSIQQQIFQSLELLNQNAALIQFSKDADTYMINAIDAAKRYIDMLKKQVALIQESIGPLMTIHSRFIEIFGEEKFDEILSKLRVSYWRLYTRDEGVSTPLTTLQTLAGSLISCNVEHIKEICNDVLDCEVNQNGQLEYPTSIRVLDHYEKDKTVAELGYKKEDLYKEIDLIANTGDHVRLAKDPQKLLTTIQAIRGNGSELQGIRNGSNVKENVKTIEEKIANLSVFCVAFSCLLSLVQTISYSAYELVYQIHTAEVNESKNFHQ